MRDDCMGSSWGEMSLLFYCLCFLCFVERGGFWVFGFWEIWLGKQLFKEMQKFFRVWVCSIEQDRFVFYSFFKDLMKKWEGKNQIGNQKFSKVVIFGVQ